MLLSRIAGASAAVLALLLTACGSQSAADKGSPAGDPITITHAQGETIIDGPAQRIAVLDLGSLDTVQALGASDRVVGVTKGNGLPESLSAFAGDEYTDLGTVVEPDLEAIAELDPDLVIAGFRTASLVEELSRNFAVVDITYDDSLSFYDGVEYSTNIIATALGAEDEAAVRLAEVETAIEDAQAAAPADSTALILMTSGGKVSAQGTESRFRAIHNELGFAPAIDDVEVATHGDAISFEAIAEANPDYLFVVDRDAAIGQEGESAEQVLDNELVATTTAWSEGNVVYLDGGRWYIMIHGVDNAVEMMNEAAASF